jgi:hypothetical protein
VSKTKAQQEESEQPQESSPRLIKYMGSSDTRIIEKGDDFDGTLADGLPATLQWDWDNRHVVDVTELGLSDAQVEVLLDYEGLEGKEFKEVTGLERIPVNLAQQLWRGAKPNARLSADTVLPDVDTALVTEEEAKRDPFGSGGGSTSPSAVSGTSTGTTGGTTATGGTGGGGGSTGNTGGTTAT